MLARKCPHYCLKMVLPVCINYLILFDVLYLKGILFNAICHTKIARLWATTSSMELQTTCILKLLFFFILKFGNSLGHFLERTCSRNVKSVPIFWNHLRRSMLVWGVLKEVTTFSRKNVNFLPATLLTKDPIKGNLGFLMNFVRSFKIVFLQYTWGSTKMSF